MSDEEAKARANTHSDSFGLDEKSIFRSMPSEAFWDSDLAPQQSGAKLSKQPVTVARKSKNQLFG